MSVNIIFRIAAVGILVTILVQVLKHSGRDEQAFLITLAGLILVLGWVIPYIYDLAHEMSELALLEYGKPFGTQRFLKRAPQHTQEIWEREEIAPRAIDREVACSLHMTHMGCSSKPEALVRQSLRAGLADGWGGSMCGTEFSDVLFGTPKPIETEANLGVMKEDEVNIIVHGHDPSLSEMICEYADDPEMIAYAKEMGAKGINVAGVCCTSNEVAMRRGVPMAGNFLQQENVVCTPLQALIQQPCMLLVLRHNQRRPPVLDAGDRIRENLRVAVFAFDHQLI